MDVIYFEIGDKTCQIPTLKSRPKIEASQRDFLKSNQSNQNQKVLFKVGTFYNNQHKLSRAFQNDMHNKLHKLNTAQ